MRKLRDVRRLWRFRRNFYVGNAIEAKKKEIKNPKT